MDTFSVCHCCMAYLLTKLFIWRGHKPITPTTDNIYIDAITDNLNRSHACYIWIRDYSCSYFGWIKLTCAILTHCISTGFVTDTVSMQIILNQIDIIWQIQYNSAKCRILNYFNIMHICPCHRYPGNMCPAYIFELINHRVRCCCQNISAFSGLPLSCIHYTEDLVDFGLPSHLTTVLHGAFCVWDPPLREGVTF